MAVEATGMLSFIQRKKTNLQTETKLMKNRTGMFEHAMDQEQRREGYDMSERETNASGVTAHCFVLFSHHSSMEHQKNKIIYEINDYINLPEESAPKADRTSSLQGRLRAIKR